ncbi:aromatic compound dioxygenase [Mycena filopes]|nr:aromatic compound dioxygenase [Mycena filopes]
MILSHTATFLLAAASFGGLTFAHPEPAASPHAQLATANFHKYARRSLASCQGELSKRGGVYERARQRRQLAVSEHKLRRSLHTRNTTTVLATDHQFNLTSINTTDISTLFDGNSSCVLAPEVTEGPYFVSGEQLRYDIREGMAGIDTFIDFQLIDVTTCEPVPSIFVDFWHANSTGAYSGVVAQGNGVGLSDEGNINNTFLRGIQETNSDGVAQWLTKFPGHYAGRATHIHIIAHQNATTFLNGTVSSATVSHVGQLFMDQTLITLVDTLAPYANNTQNLTLNADDTILAQEADTIDPMLDYVLLGDEVEDGLFMWAAMGIDTTANHTVNPAVYLTSSGGVVNPNAPAGGGNITGCPPSSASASASASACVAPSGAPFGI